MLNVKNKNKNKNKCVNRSAEQSRHENRGVRRAAFIFDNQADGEDWWSCRCGGGSAQCVDEVSMRLVQVLEQNESDAKTTKRGDRLVVKTNEFFILGNNISLWRHF